MKIFLFAAITLLSLSSLGANRQKRERRHFQEVRFMGDVSEPDVAATTIRAEDDERGAEVERLARETAARLQSAPPTATDAEFDYYSDQPAVETEVRRNQNTRRGSAQSAPSTPSSTTPSDTMFSCPPCAGSSKDRLKAALSYFWKEAHEDAFACACHVLREQADNGLAQALVYALGEDLKADLSIPEQIAGPPVNDAPAMSDHWQVLGPFPVSKLELDADPAFDSHEAQVRASRDEANTSSHRGGSWNDSWALDPTVHVLTLEGRVLSEYVPGGWVSWKAARSAPAQQGVTPVFFSQTPWQELAASLQTPVVYEFQAWARTVTYVREAGVYVLNCQGVHSAYLRTLRSSRLLAGDVYMSGQFAASLELSAGPVGIVLPLRGMAQSKFYCHLSPQQPLDRTSSIRLSPPRLVPHLLVPLRQSEMHGISRRTAALAGLDKEWFLQEGYTTAASPRGLLLSGLFALPVSNTHAHPLTVSFAVEAREGAQRLGKFSLKVAWRSGTWGNGTEGAAAAAEPPPLIVAPGQTLFVPLELVPDQPPAPGRVPLIPCSPSMVGPRLVVTVTPSRGRSQAVELALECRRQNQSFLVSFLDDDGSVAQAAVLFPLPTAEQRAAWSTADSTDGRSLLADSCADQGQGQGQGQDKEDGKGKSCTPSAGAKSFPVLTSLHGTGIAPLSQADAYKIMPPGQRQYVFGVEGFFVLAPSRFGAHNWEAVGAQSAVAALQALKATLARVPALPQVDTALGIIAGHSMGAHGALVAAANQPSDYSCLSATALWISKEWYAAANAFFQADVQMPLTPPQLQAVLAQALSEFHTDRFASNMVALQSHLRVGSSDATTHPFFARRMHRALRREGANATLEEVRGKEHWWWDTASDNDGGVLNDPTMRAFYKGCLKLRGSRPRCPLGRTWTVRAVNPHSQKGECGVAVAQQQRSLSPSAVSVRCDFLPPPPRNEGEKQQQQRAERKEEEAEDSGVLACRAETQNVRALLVSFAPEAFGLPANVRVELSVDGSPPLGLASPPSPSPSPSLVCVQHGAATPCAPHPLEQRLPSTYGLARAVYSRPLIVVYGTPPSSALRVALRDLAVYLGNAIALAHHGLVRVVSDVEFKSHVMEYSALEAGLLFVGGPPLNKAARLVYGNFQPGESNSSSSSGQPLLSRATVGFASTGSSEAGTPPSFSVGSAIFTAATDAVLATFPLLYPASRPGSGDASRLGLLLHANSAEGFFALSRLAWPVVPPMVRAPFAAYMPDYLVLDQRVWAQGFGAVKMAGFWTWNWQPDEPWAFSAD